MTRAVSAAALGLGLAALSASPALALALETLPAGDYVVRPLDGVEPAIVEIRSTDGRHAVLALAVDGSPGARGTQPELIFDRYGEKEFLHAVRLPDEKGAVLEPSPSELQAARDLAAPTAAHGPAGK